MNEEIREKIDAAGLYQYEVAELCGIGESTLIRWLRKELSAERKAKILSAIEKGGNKNGKNQNN